jgi:hypothetical protein
VAALLMVVAAGCGGSSRSQEAAIHQIPRALAQDWEGQASEIAAVAGRGDSCRALQLASSLRNEIDASRAKLPRRLRAPLLSGVNSLADRITCSPPVTTVPKKPPKPPHEGHGHHGHPGHGHGGGDGGGNDQ